MALRASVPAEAVGVQLMDMVQFQAELSFASRFAKGTVHGATSDAQDCTSLRAVGGVGAAIVMYAMAKTVEATTPSVAEY